MNRSMAQNTPLIPVWRMSNIAMYPETPCWVKWCSSRCALPGHQGIEAMVAMKLMRTESITSVIESPSTPRKYSML